MNLVQEHFLFPAQTGSLKRILSSWYMVHNYYKKTWTTYFVYVSEVSANTYAPYTSKSPRHWRERSDFYSWCLFYFADFQRPEYKANASSYNINMCNLAHGWWMVLRRLMNTLSCFLVGGIDSWRLPQSYKCWWRNQNKCIVFLFCFFSVAFCVCFV